MILMSVIMRWENEKEKKQQDLLKSCSHHFLCLKCYWDEIYSFRWWKWEEKHKKCVVDLLPYIGLIWIMFKVKTAKRAILKRKDELFIFITHSYFRHLCITVMQNKTYRLLLLVCIIALLLCYFHIHCPGEKLFTYIESTNYFLRCSIW